MTSLKLILPFIFAAGLAGCSGPTHLDQAENTGPAATAFAEGLRQGYISLSLAEQQEADGRDSIAFAEKAIRAAMNGDVAPDNFSNRDIAARYQDVLGAARGRLMAAKNNVAAPSVAHDLARAQIGFDCWMQEQEEGWQPSHIAACRRRFETAMTSVEEAYAAMAVIEPEPEKVIEPEPEIITKPEPEPEAVIAPEVMVAPGPFVVYFEFDHSILSRAARGILNQALADLGGYDYVMILVAGHADRAGPESYNMGLAERRAQTVASFLIAGGVEEAKIRVSFFGEDRVAVETADGIRESLNRRVEIVIE